MKKLVRCPCGKLYTVATWSVLKDHGTMLDPDRRRVLTLKECLQCRAVIGIYETAEEVTRG